MHTIPRYAVKATHHVLRVVDGAQLCPELADLALVARRGHRQVIHAERPEGAIELWADVLPDARRVKRCHRLLHGAHHRHARLDVTLRLVQFVAFVGLLELLVL